MTEDVMQVALKLLDKPIREGLTPDGSKTHCALVGLGSLTERNEIKMNAEEKVSWLNEHDPRRKWAVGDDVRCRGCGAVFKVERTAMDYVGDPTCPHCIGSTPADFEKVLHGQKV